MKIHYLLGLIAVLVMFSCGKEQEDAECKDYFEANKEILTGVWDWFPYERGNHEVVYVNESGTNDILTIIRSERIKEDIIGPIFKCPEVPV